MTDERMIDGMRILVCTEASGWNIQLQEIEADTLEETAKAIAERMGTGAQFPFEHGGEEYTVFYDDEIFLKGKEKLVASLYVYGDTTKSYLDPEGPDLVFGDFAMVKGHAHDGSFAGLSDEDIKSMSAFVLESDAKLKEMRKAKLFKNKERIRPYAVKRER